MGFHFRSTSLLPQLMAVGMSACASGSGPVPTEQVVPALPSEVRETSTGAIIRISAEQLVVETEVKVPVELAWSLLPRVYSALGIDGRILDSEARVYGTRRFTKSRVGNTRVSDYVRCAFQGAGPSAAGGYRTQLSIATRVEGSTSEWTTVSSQISGTATSAEGTSTDAVRCVSNGNLERLIARMVADSAAS
jgi:hypothetical protein